MKTMEEAFVILEQDFDAFCNMGVVTYKGALGVYKTSHEAQQAFDTFIDAGISEPVVQKVRVGETADTRKFFDFREQLFECIDILHNMQLIDGKTKSEFCERLFHKETFDELKALVKDVAREILLEKEN